MSKSKLHKIFAIGLLCLSTLPLQSQAADTETNLAKETFPSLALAQPEISNLNDKIAAIKARYEKEMADASRPVSQHYAEELDALKNERQDELESADEFKAKQEKTRDELITQRDSELAMLSQTKKIEAETAPLKARIKALTEHHYVVGAEAINAELGAYDADRHQFPIKLRSKLAVFSLKLSGTVLLQAEEAESFVKQWQSGVIQPEASATLAGELLELALLNTTNNIRWIAVNEVFYSPAILQALSPAALNEVFQPGRDFKDCSSCPDMIVIPAGSFDMGADNGERDERPVHRVTIRQPFAIGKTEITQGEWKAVMHKNPSFFKSCGDTCPVEQVSWNDAQEFIQRLNDKTGKQYRLPSEAEWEYSCRAGEQQEFCGNDKVGNAAWYSKNSAGLTHAAAQKKSNAWGLHEMSGNVWEWVEDSYHADYNGAPVDGTAWQGDGAQRVLRGGSWNLIPELVRAGVRFGAVPTLRDYYYGFRVARALP